MAASSDESATQRDLGAAEQMISAKRLSGIGTVGSGIVGLATGGPIGAAAAFATSYSTVYLSSESYTVATSIAGITCALLIPVGGFGVLLGVSGLTGIGTSAVASYLCADSGSESRDESDDLREALALTEAQDSDDSASDLQQQLVSKQLSDGSETSCNTLDRRTSSARSLPCCCMDSFFAFFRKRSDRDLESPPISAHQAALRKRSRSLFLSQIEQARVAGVPTLLLYGTSTSSKQGGVLKRKAHPMSFDGTGDDLIDNDYFRGRLVFMHRATREGKCCKHEEYFATRTRRWELRVQGTFKQKPRGRLFAGVVMPQFDYTNHVNFFAKWLTSLSYGPLESTIGAKIHFVLGDRAEAAEKPDAELAHVVGGLEIFDQVIVTPGGLEQVPPICGDLSAFGGTRRAAGSSSKWASTVREIAENIDTTQTYTFCFWGAASFIDLPGDSLSNLMPLLPSVSLSNSILGPWPPHFVFYDLEQGAADSDVQHTDSDADAYAKHAESRKKYFMDVMVVNPAVRLNLAAILGRYCFAEKPGTDSDRECRRSCGSDSWLLVS